MIGMPWRGTHAAELSIVGTWGHQQDAHTRSGATFLGPVRATRANPVGDQCASGLLWLSGRLIRGDGALHRRAPTDGPGSRLTTRYCCPSTSVRIGSTVTAHRDGVRKILLASCRCTVALEFLVGRSVPSHWETIQSACACACALGWWQSVSQSVFQPVTLSYVPVSVPVSILAPVCICFKCIS